MENVTNLPIRPCERCQDGLPPSTSLSPAEHTNFYHQNLLQKIKISNSTNYLELRNGIKKEHLCKAKLKGGLALPNFMAYYWAGNTRFMFFWLDDTYVSSDWLEMERENCLPYSIGSVTLSPVVVDKSCYRNNPIIHSTVRIWKQVGKHFNLRKVSFLLPIASNP